MKAGDHIRILAPGAAVHAIDVGDRTVIHFEAGAGVRRSMLADLAGDARVEVVTHAVRTYPPKQVVARAFSRFAESAYAAMFAGSEAFAVWCKIGQLPPAPVTSAPAGPPPSGEGASTPRPRAKPAARRPDERSSRPASKSARPSARTPGPAAESPARRTARRGAKGSASAAAKAPGKRRSRRGEQAATRETPRRGARVRPAAAGKASRGRAAAGDRRAAARKPKATSRRRPKKR